MSRIGYEILFLFLLMLFNGMLAMAELSLVSARKSRLEQRAQKGERGASTALQLLENPTRLLSSIQVGITMIGVLTGAVGGATLSDEMGELVARIPALAPYSTSIGFGLVVVAITYFSLVFGELVPKRLALTRPDSYASALSGPLWVISWIGAPLVYVLTFSTDTLLRLLNLKTPNEPVLVNEEIRALLQEGTEQGAVEVAEKKMVEGVLRLDELRVGAILTPRTEIEWIDLSLSAQDAKDVVLNTGHSVYPAAKDTLDNIVGFIRARDVLGTFLQSEPRPLESFVVKGLFVPDSTTALATLELLKEKRQPVAFVVDEYGGVEGMITVSDIVRAIVGDVPHTADEEEMGIREREDGSLLVDGLLSINEFEHSLPWELEAGDFESEYHTMGGFVMERLGRVPTEGDQFEWRGLRFEVIDTDGMRVDKIIITRAPRNEPAPVPEEAPVATVANGK
jgi:putative hemolysin